MEIKRNIKGFVDKRATELYLEWKKENPFFFTDNGYEPPYEKYRLEALIEFLEKDRA